MSSSRGRIALRSLLGWVLWLGLLLSTALGGQALGRSALAPPPLTDPGSWAQWAGARPPLEASFAVLGLLVVALAWYLLAVSVLSVGARLWGARRLVTVVDLLTLPVVRRSIHAAVAAGLVGTGVAGVGADRAQPAVAIVSLGEAVAAPTTTLAEAEATRDDRGDAGDPPVMQLLPEDTIDEVSREAGSLPQQPTAGHGEWEVRPGDHLWSVAVRVLAQAGFDAGSDGEVVRYWNRLIEANTDRLADPKNPDLIYPGQVLVVPSPPAPGQRALP